MELYICLKNKLDIEATLETVRLKRIRGSCGVTLSFDCLLLFFDKPSANYINIDGLGTMSKQEFLDLRPLAGKGLDKLALQKAKALILY